MHPPSHAWIALVLQIGRPCAESSAECPGRVGEPQLHRPAHSVDLDASASVGKLVSTEIVGLWRLSALALPGRLSGGLL